MASENDGEEVSGEAQAGNPRVLSAEVHETLNALYASGMTGWGKRHSVCLNIAKERTGLRLPQIKVGAFGCTFSTYNSVLCVIHDCRTGLEELIW